MNYIEVQKMRKEAGIVGSLAKLIGSKRIPLEARKLNAMLHAQYTNPEGAAIFNNLNIAKRLGYQPRQLEYLYGKNPKYRNFLARIAKINALGTKQPAAIEALKLPGMDMETSLKLIRDPRYLDIYDKNKQMTKLISGALARNGYGSISGGMPLDMKLQSKADMAKYTDVYNQIRDIIEKPIRPLFIKAPTNELTWWQR